MQKIRIQASGHLAKVSKGRLKEATGTQPGMLTFADFYLCLLSIATAHKY